MNCNPIPVLQKVKNATKGAKKVLKSVISPLQKLAFWLKGSHLSPRNGCGSWKRKRETPMTQEERNIHFRRQKNTESKRKERKRKILKKEQKGGHKRNSQQRGMVKMIAEQEAKEEIKERKGIDYGMDMASKYRIDKESFKREVSGKFVRWSIEIPVHESLPCSLEGNVLAMGGRYVMRVDKNYGDKNAPNKFENWVYIKKSNLKGDGTGAGLFADRGFVKNQVVGIYTGCGFEACDKDDVKHSLHPYRLLNSNSNNAGIDALGGIGSGNPVGMGMHFMNDPNFYGMMESSNPNADRKTNCAFVSGGKVIAMRRIYRDDELLVSYNIHHG